MPLIGTLGLIVVKMIGDLIDWQVNLLACWDLNGNQNNAPGSTFTWFGPPAGVGIMFVPRMLVEHKWIGNAHPCVARYPLNQLLLLNYDQF